MAGCVVFSLPKEFQPQYGTEQSVGHTKGLSLGTVVCLQDC